MDHWTENYCCEEKNKLFFGKLFCFFIFLKIALPTNQKELENMLSNFHSADGFPGLLQNYRPPTGHRLPTTDHRPTDRSSTDPPTNNHQPTDKCSPDPPTSVLPTHRQVFHQPTDHRLTDRSSTDPPITDSPILLQLTNNPFIHQSYFNRVTIGAILSF